MTTVLGPVPEHLRARACEVLGHVPPADLGLPGCPVPDADLVEQLIARVEHLAAVVAGAEQQRLDDYLDGLGNR